MIGNVVEQLDPGCIGVPGEDSVNAVKDYTSDPSLRIRKRDTIRANNLKPLLDWKSYASRKF